MWMSRRQTRAGQSEGAAQPVITVISDDDEDDVVEVNRPRQAAATAAGQQHGAREQQQVEVVQVSDDEPEPTMQAAAAPAAAAEGPPAQETLKQQHCEQPPPAAAAAGSESDGDDSGSGCIICMELMSEQGGHRPATLKCGHIFGEGCIRRWLGEKARCPQCNKKAKVRDITALFNLPKKVAAGSGAAALELEQQLQQAQQKAEAERKRAQQLEQQLQRMQQELARQRQQQPQARVSPAAPLAQRLQQLQQQQWQYQQQQHRQQQPMRWLIPPSGTLPGLPMSASAQADPWSYSALLLMSGGHLSDTELATFMQHPNTATYFGPQFARPAQQPQQQQQQELQRQRQLLQAAVAGRKRTHQQSSATDTSTATAGAAAGASGRGSLPPGAAAAAAAEARAQAAGQAVSSPGSVGSIQPSNLGPGSSSSSGGNSQPVMLLMLLPVLQQQEVPWWQQQAVLQTPGTFDLLQEYELMGSRAFDLDVDGTLLTVAEGPTSQACGRLRRISMLAPGSPAYVLLPPAVGQVRCLARQPVLAAGGSSSSSAALMAVATDRGGLIIAKPSTNNIIATVPTHAPVWSVAWSHSNEQQLLLGLDKGRLALVDLRMTGSRALVLMTGTPSSSSSSSSGAWFDGVAGPSMGSNTGGPAGAAGAASPGLSAAPGQGQGASSAASAAAAAAAAAPNQPWHSLVMLPHGWQQQHAAGIGEDCVTPEALLACPAGVYCWSASQPNAFQLLLPSSLHGGQCEGLALAPDGTTLAASFRRPMGINSSSVQPAHWLAQLAPAQLGAPEDLVPAGAAAAVGPSGTAAAAVGPGGSDGVAAAVAAGRQQLASSTLQLTGHSSMQQMTHGCFMPALPDLPGEGLLFASADEGSCEPRLWGCGSGRPLLQRASWVRMSSPVLQLAGGRAGAFDAVLLGVLSERQLKVYSYSAGQAQ